MADNLNWKKLQLNNYKNKTFNEIISEIGSDNVTLHIPTNINIDSITIPSNIKLHWEDGGGFTILPGANVVIEGGFANDPDWQIIDCALADVPAITGRIMRPEWFGLLAGNTASQNAAALQKSINAIPSNAEWILPPGTWSHNSELLVSSKSFCKFTFLGILQNDNYSNSLHFYKCNRIEVRGISINNTTNDFRTNTYSGLKLTSCTMMNIEVKYINNFNKGIYLCGDAEGGGTPIGNAYNSFFLTIVNNCKYGIYCDSINNGYVAQNQFFGGRISLDSAQYALVSSNYESTGAWAVYFEGTPAPSHLYTNMFFFGVCTEYIHNGLFADSATGFIWTGPRNESVPGTWIKALSGLYNTALDMGLMGFDPEKMNLNETVQGIAGRQGGNYQYDSSKYRAFFTDQEYGGISFFSPTDAERNVIELYSSKYDGRLLQLKDQAGNIQTINKCYDDSITSIPDGTYRKGAVIWNTSINNEVSPFAVCKSSGTKRTIAAITATSAFTDNHYRLTVSSSAELREGDYIYVAGVGAPLALQISTIPDSTHICVFQDLGGYPDVAGAALTLITPTFAISEKCLTANGYAVADIFESNALNQGNKSHLTMRNSPDVQLATTDSGRIVFGTYGSTANFSYTAKDDSSKRFTLDTVDFKYKIAVPDTKFTIGSNSYTVVFSLYNPYTDTVVIQVVEDISGESSTGTLTNVIYHDVAMAIVGYTASGISEERKTIQIPTGYTINSDTYKSGGTQVVGARGAALTAQTTTLTCAAPSTPDYAISDGTAGAGSSDEWRTVIASIINLQTRVSELEARLKATGGHGLIADPA